jgi:hypothetical protein
MKGERVVVVQKENIHKGRDQCMRIVGGHKRYTDRMRMVQDCMLDV